jgi:hypothetical protein
MALKEHVKLYNLLAYPVLLAGSRYLLRDDFEHALEAGAVDGTKARPGPGTRTVIDTENKISISAGKLAIAGGKTSPGIGDPGLWLDGIARQAGRMLIHKSNGDTATSLVGFGTAQAGLIAENSFGLNTAFLERNSGGAMNVGSRSADTDYLIATILRSAGAYYLVKGGAFTEWTLLWVTEIGETATVYPGIESYNSQIDFDFLRIPRNLWLPTPLAYDSFTTGGALIGLSTETSGPDGQVTPAIAWEDLISGNSLYNYEGVVYAEGGPMAAVVDSEENDVIVSAEPSTNCGVVLRAVDNENYIYAILEAGDVASLYKVIANTPTQVINDEITPGEGAKLVIVADGTSFSMYYNNAKVGTTQTIDDAELQTSGKHGIYLNDGSLDNFCIFPRGSNGDYQILNQYCA